jgi:CHAD domain-containing protein
LVLHGQRVVAELCLDTARLPGEDHLFREVEIELRSAGNGRDLASMVSVLKEEWGLADVSESKFTRALALASPRTRVALVRTPARPIHAGLHPGATMAEAARRTIAFHFQRMLDHEPGTRLGEDPEELHDMRVATRRMRAALQLFAAHLDPLVMKPHRRGLRLTGRALGAVRDLDVFHGKTLRYLESLPEVRRGEIDSFLAGLNRARDAARAELIRYLDSKEYRTFCERLGEFLDAPGAGAASTTGSEGQPLAHQVRHVVPGELYRHYAAVRAFDDPLSEPDAHLGLYHRLRITGKSLRYTLEFFADVLGNGSKYLIERMKALQDHLGDLQDAVVASGLLNDFLRRGVWGADEGQEVGLPVRVAPGVAAYLTARQNEMQKLLETFPPVWDQVRKPEFGRRLGALAVTLVTRGDRSRAAGGAEDAEEE